MENKDNPNLIECGNHNWAPYSIICIHLISGKSREWLHIPIAEDDGREVDGDWVCPKCDEIIQERGYKEEIMKYLRPVCMHCARDLRKRYDPKYTEAEHDN